MITLLLTALLGPISPDEFRAQGGLILSEPQNVQLVPGAGPRLVSLCAQGRKGDLLDEARLSGSARRRRLRAP